jgi:uncharacterized protein YgiB involved in biofilm formation
MSRRPRKSSTCVTLVLIGAAAVSGCSDPPATSRKAAYASKQECLADWGDEKECDEQVAPRTGSSSSGSHIYWGPSGRSPSRNFGSSGSSSSSRSSSSSSSHSTSRGGFGSHGSSAS